MKIINGILGCALVAGLMTFASDKAQAGGLVIGGTVYAPFNLKLATQYDSNGKQLKKASITSKEFLKDLGYNSDVILAVDTDTYHVWVVNKKSKTLVADLSTNDTLSIEFEYSQEVQPNSNKESYKEVGIFYVYSDAFGPDSDYFDVSGMYMDSYSYGSNSTYKENLKAKALSGYGFFLELTDSDVPVTGSASYSGSGKTD